MSTLDGVVPYSALPGNHDYDFLNANTTLGVLGPGTEDRSATLYLQYFGPARHGASAFAGGVPTASNFFVGASPNGLNSAQLFSGAGQKFLHLALEWEAPDAELQWAQTVIDTHQTLPVIISTHSYVWDQPDAEGRTGNAYGTNPRSFRIHKVLLARGRRLRVGAPAKRSGTSWCVTIRRSSWC
jgi:hypothetical protein